MADAKTLRERGNEAIRSLGHVLMKRRLVALLALGATVTATFMYTERQPRIYRAWASVIVDHRSPSVLSSVKEVIELGSGSYWSTTEYLKTQLEVIKSRQIAKRVVDRLGLAMDERFLGLADLPLTPKQKLGRMAEMDAVGVFMANLDATLKMDSRVIVVSMDHQDPAMAADVVNTLAEEYRDQNLEYRRQIIREANDELRRMQESLRAKKEDAERQVMTFEHRNGVGSLESRQTAVQARLLALNDRYTQVNIDRINLETSHAREELADRIREIEEDLAARDITGSTFPKVVESEVVSSLRTQLVDLEVKEKEIDRRYGEKHPALASVKEQRRLVRRSMEGAVERILRADLSELQRRLKEEEDKLTALQDTEKGLLQELRAARAEENALKRIQLEYEPLKNRLADAAKVYDNVRERYQETTLSAQVETNNVRVQDYAIQPDRPIKPNFRFNLLAGMVLGLLLAVGVAYFAESLDTTLRDRADVEEIPGLFFLGILPSIRHTIQAVGNPAYSRERDLYPFFHPKSSASEHLRSIQTNLLYADPGRRPRTFLVVSPNPREGKTTLAVHISLTFAMSGLRTVIVDTDMRRPRIHKVFGQTPANGGVAAHLIQGGDVGQFINATEVPNLHLMGCGIRPPNPVELLQSRAFPQLLEALRQRYDIVIFDSPPMLAVADSRILATHVDAIICVAKARQTSRDALREGRRYLDGVFTRPVGCVMNDVDMSSGSYHYYYYYGTKYGYYAPTDEILDEEEAAVAGAGARLRKAVKVPWRRRSA
ncbi:MAG: polysaccharide biosynthesis tyrosine autokinase [Deltaproteobacteria bacterium]|nr:polysaccharide biosynthesis tyrosine autokinase [Deltaproteobacteria bacterium]